MFRSVDDPKFGVQSIIMKTTSVKSTSLARIVNLSNLNKTSKPKSFSQNIFVHTKDTIHVVNPYEILFIKADGSYAEIYLKSGEKHVASKTLKSFLNKLREDSFQRVHNSFLVNINWIHKLTRANGMLLHLEGGYQIPVSRNRQKALLELMK
ncbi:MAG: LytTR family DNA-binding domain-containing protein [Bacteroidota bacterium]